MLYQQSSRRAPSRLAATRSNCPGGNAITPVLRIDAMEQRLDAMLHAIEVLQPALHEFYELLSSEQKVRFNLLAPTAG